MTSIEGGASAVEALTEAYRKRERSPVEVARAMLAHIAETHDAINAFVHVDEETTLGMARASENRWRAGTPLGALDGVPVSIKDLIAVEGWPLVRGSPALLGAPPPAEDAPAAARLREAGAVFLGKTATPDSGCRIFTSSLVHGVTRNPHDPARTPGGSSGGASAALAAGIGPIALGTDGAGSIRIPAAWSGVYGLKPGFGRVPVHPHGIFAPHSVTGPMARDVRSAALLLDVLARAEPRDPYVWPVAFDLPAALGGDVRGLRIGISPDFGMGGRKPRAEDLAAIAEAGALFERAGAVVENAKHQWPCDPLQCFTTLWEATYAGHLAIAFDAEGREKVDPALRAIAARGEAIGMARYHRAIADRAAIATAARALFNRFDLLIGPVIPFGPPPVGQEAPDGGTPGDWSWCSFTYVWNMTGQPAASVPWGLDGDGLPLGVQIVGWAGAEEKVLRASAAVEAERGLVMLR